MRLLAALFCGVCSLAGQTPSLRYCVSSAELMKYDSMNVGVRIGTSNRELATEFARAMNFWATVIEMRWHDEPSSLCAVQILDGGPELFADSTVAKALFAGPAGSVAFNPKAPLTREELYLTAVHEIGHLLGLTHNPNVASVMYYTNDAAAETLDSTDLLQLSGRHRLRRPVGGPVRCNNVYSAGLPPALFGKKR